MAILRLTADYFIQAVNDEGQFFVGCFCQFITDTVCRKRANLIDLNPYCFGSLDSESSRVSGKPARWG
jgi:hypothetical protein